MARTITEIRDIMLAEKAAQSALDDLTSTSVTAIWRLIFYIVAVCIWSLEKLYDIFKLEVADTIARKNPHQARWYVEKAKEFQYGYTPVAEKDYYDNTGIAPDVVLASQIIAYAALVELPFIRLKVAKKVGANLAPLSAPELAAFVAWVLRFKDAGVKLKTSTITSTAPDNLKLILRIKYNPLVLNSTGGRLDATTATPVPDGIKAYLANKSSEDFNGLFSAQKLIDAIQAIDGVEDLSVDSMQKKYGALPFTAVDIDFIPDSGYLVIEDVDLQITYIPA